MAAELPPIRVFVYGSLKQGGRYHEHYCRGLREPTPARVWGQLFRQPTGYAMLRIPPAHVLALGSDDSVADTLALADWRSRPLPEFSATTEDGWEWIVGELFTFDNGPQRLAKLDLLEDFRAGEPSLYHRVIAPTVPVGAAQAELVWTYVAPQGNLPPGCVRIGPSWP